MSLCRLGSRNEASPCLPGINDPVPALREQQALVQLVIGVAEIGLAIVEEILRGVRTADPFLPCGPDQVEGIVPFERHHLEIRRSIPSEDRSHGCYDANGCQQANDCTLAHDNSSAFLERVKPGKCCKHRTDDRSGAKGQSRRTLTLNREQTCPPSNLAPCFDPAVLSKSWGWTSSWFSSTAAR